jgi:hypothetical protein
MEPVVNPDLAFSELVADTISNVALTQVTLFLNMNQLDADEPDHHKMLELDSLANTVLEAAAGQLTNLGINLEVFRMDGLYEYAKFLIQPGWTLPQPRAVRPARAE